MIQLENLKDVLAKVGFVKDSIGDYYKRNYDTCIVAVDFDNKSIIYPEENGLRVHDKTTSNFEHPENFVVLECVCRLLEKGYRPEHIELEPRWTLGHDAKGGKADIQVKDDEGKSLLIIECKTAGSEFNKEKKKTEEDGGQLFSYWQQEISTRWLALYASDWKENALSYNCLVINCTDDANIAKMAEKDNDVKIFSKARNDKERFEVWEETYQKQWLDDVIFNEESQAYKIGISPLRKKKLKDFTPDDRIVNRFEEILRHNNVSDKENAFNRLVALFICKLVDEIKKQDFDVVDFQYKQGQDTYESLQDRLQHLHQQGMEEFMKEKIFYVEADYAERLFKQYTGRQRKAAIEDLNRTIRILKFYSNNDFAFKDVHNEELFYQNGKILVEVVQLFQHYRIVYPSKHQFLGDLFERLLKNGFKQNEGQYFTPTPITRFVWDSLPLQNYINEHDLPRVIDYACGAGHFLTEAVEAIDSVRPDGDNSWVEKHIYGIEKDYRLARVSKISMFMNGAGGCNIIFGDGLENYPEKDITPASFDILVANPPYAVNGFKAHLKLKNDSFTILDTFTSTSKEIENLFIERMVQLVKPCGLAAVVLPNGVLNNSLDCYTAARKLLYENFYLRSIVDLGYNVFGATGSSTVILFLEKYNEPPRLADLANDTVTGIVTNDDDDWEDVQVLNAYVAHQNIEKETYLRFLRQNLSKEEIKANVYLRYYLESFSWGTIKIPQRSNDKEKAQILKDKFYTWALSVEREKLYYFSLIYSQKTLVITAPSNTQDKKKFLGFNWSSTRGKEGIKIKQPGGMLYNEKDRFARGTLACAIRNSFTGASTALADDVSTFAHTYLLKDLISFGVPDVNLLISTRVSSNVKVKSNYPIVKLFDLVNINQLDFNPTKYPEQEFVYVDIASIENGTGKISLEQKILGKNAPSRARRLVVKGNTILSTVRPNLKAFAYADRDFDNTVFSTGFAILMPKDEKELIPKLLYLFFMNMDFLMQQIIEKMPKGQYPSINKNDIESLRIPLPPIPIQKIIISECDKIDEEYNNSRMSIDTYRQKIADIFERLEVVSRGGNLLSVNNLCKYITLRTSEIDMESYITTDNMLQNCEGIRPYDGTDNITSAIAYQKGDILLSNIRPYLKKIWQADRNGSCSPDVLVLRPDKDKVNERFLYYSLRRDVFFDYIMNEAGTRGLKMPRGNKDGIIQYRIILPDMKEQRKVADEISYWDALIAEAKNTMAGCNIRKKAVFDKYLK